VRNTFINAVSKHQNIFGLSLPADTIDRLADYYELVQEHNDLLHLVAPCSAEEFAIRHILESLTLLEHLPDRARFADIGAGAGLPSIPCLLVRDDLRAVLIESKPKKSNFLEMAVSKLGIRDRVEIIDRQFEEVPAGTFEYVTCRALDKFTNKLPRLLKWSGRRKLLLFGGNNLRDKLQQNAAIVSEQLTPMSEQRFLFVAHSRL
jgi:16S rRNA (guanine(527)-N(7))-methyltransferase RsmG